MGRTLLLFVAAPGVGVYVNVMASSVDKYNVDNIVLVRVIGYPSGELVDFAKFVKTTLPETISGLVEGVYKEFEPYREKPSPETKDNKLYKKLNDIFVNSYHIETISYQLLGEDVARLKNVYGSRTIMDISGLPKRMSIDILTACLAIDIPYIMLFELKKQARGIDSFYHNLSPLDYEHVVLPQWKALTGNIEFFSARQNRKNVWKVIGAILLSLVLTGTIARWLFNLEISLL